MSWQRYELIFRLLSPMHIGWRKSGNLQQTRGYVPGKNFWAALTARLTRGTGQGANGRAYVEMGEWVTKHFRFPYLYPALQENGAYRPHYPWEEDFDYLFANSYTSTALNYTTQSAEEAMLHETEFIAPHTRTGQPVYLAGALFARTDLPPQVAGWQSALERLQFGADRGYGWGRVQLLRCQETERIEGDTVTVAVNETITAHLMAENAMGVTGPIEPLIGWERNNRPGANTRWQLSQTASICYVPGSTVAQEQRFLIGDYGLLQAES